MKGGGIQVNLRYFVWNICEQNNKREKRVAYSIQTARFLSFNYGSIGNSTGSSSSAVRYCIIAQ